MPAPNEDKGLSRNAREQFEAAMARVEARQIGAMAAHERAIAMMEQRMAAAIHAHERAIAAMEVRMAAAMQAREQAIADIERRMAAAAGRRPEPPKRRRGLGGGEPVPAVPKPRPSSLTGGAAGPIDEDGS